MVSATRRTSFGLIKADCQQTKYILNTLKSDRLKLKYSQGDRILFLA
ncbi:MAG: hypothetical protein AAFR77_19015 [Cyanobacteria bacterium J06631_2]